jgi:hypothetical protein
MSQAARLNLERHVLTVLREDPSLMHRMPETAWDAADFVVDQRWRFLASIVSLSEAEGARFALWYAGLREGAILMQRAMA